MKELNCWFSEKSEFNFWEFHNFLRFVALPQSENSKKLCSSRSIFQIILSFFDLGETSIVKKADAKKTEKEVQSLNFILGKFNMCMEFWLFSAF